MTEPQETLLKSEARTGARKLADALPEAIGLPLRRDYSLRVERFLVRWGRRLVRVVEEGEKP